MRCYGLTDDRHRCSTDVQDTTNFCAEHRAMEQIEQPAQPAPETRGGVARFFATIEASISEKRRARRREFCGTRLAQKAFDAAGD